MPVEFELKFRATEAAQAEILKDRKEAWQTIEMQTTYYDTPDARLARRHFTLRRRLENGCSVCTVKAPAGPVARGEWETNCDNIVQAIPVLCKLGGPEELLALTRDGVIPVCGARFTRQAAQIRLEETQLELALDRGILFSETRQVPLCEVEVELKAGSPEKALAFAAQLARYYRLEKETKSKFARARALREEETHGTAE